MVARQAANVREIAAFAATLSKDIEVDLLAYNPLGEGKYESLGKGSVDHMQVQSEEYVDGLRNVVNKELMKGRLTLVR